MGAPHRSAFVVAFGVLPVFCVAVTVVLIYSGRQQALMDANWPMKYLLVAILQYAEKNAGAFPTQDGYQGLLKLYSSGILSEEHERLLSDPRQRSVVPWQEINEESDVGYWYIGGYDLESGRDVPILIQKKYGHWGYVGYADGRVLRETNDRWEKIRRRVGRPTAD